MASNYDKNNKSITPLPEAASFVLGEGCRMDIGLVRPGEEKLKSVTFEIRGVCQFFFLSLLKSGEEPSTFLSCPHTSNDSNASKGGHQIFFYPISATHMRLFDL